MSKTRTISEIYDIATAFITDRKTTVDVSYRNGHLMYKFTKRGLDEYPYTLVISAERGAPAKIPNTNQTNKKTGHVYLQRGTALSGMYGPQTIVSAETKHNVGRAIDSTQSDIVKFGTRMLSPKFFELVKLAEKRAFSKIETSDNTPQMFNLLYRIQNENLLYYIQNENQK